MKQIVALLLSALLAAPGCASATRRYSTAPAPGPNQKSMGRVDPALMADYIRQLPVGSRVQITMATGKVLHGTLIKRDADPIVVQLRMRVPEPPVEIAVAEISAVELETSGTPVGRVVAIGVAAGAAATFGVLLLLAAIFSD
jgi:hypothetical protein